MLTRSAPLKRGKRLRRRRETVRRSGRVRDTAFLAWVHTQRCMAAELLGPGHVCEGPIEADHAGARPLGRKADDATSIPLCLRAHRERTDFAGAFREEAAFRQELALAVVVIPLGLWLGRKASKRPLEVQTQLITERVRAVGRARALRGAARRQRPARRRIRGLRAGRQRARRSRTPTSYSSRWRPMTATCCFTCRGPR